MFVPFAFGSWDDDLYGLPATKLENMYAQAAPDHLNRDMRLVPTPGLVEFASGFITGLVGIFQSDGVLGGDVIAATGSRISRVASGGTVTVLTGAFSTFTAPSPQFAASQTPELVLVAGGQTYLVGSTSFSSFSWSGPTGNITSVDVIGQRHLYTEAGSGRLWISETADATTVNKFVTAETDPDELRCVKVSGSSIYLFGSRRTEVAYLTGDDTTPVAFRPGAAFDYGVRGARAVARTNDGLAFVASDDNIYLIQGGQLRPIGTTPLIDRIQRLTAAQKDELELDYYTQLGHKFVKMTIPGHGDWFYDTTLGFWHRRRRISSIESGVGPTTKAFGRVLCLDNVSGAAPKLLELSPRNYQDDGSAIRRVATAVLPLTDTQIEIKRALVEGQMGLGLDGTVQGSDPMMMVRVAPDGRSFDHEITRSLGKIGEFGRRAEISPIGVMGGSPIAVEFALSDPVPFSLTGLHLNKDVRR